MTCPICASSDTRVSYELIECSLLACDACGHCFSRLLPGASPEVYGEDYYLERHRSYFENPDRRLFARTLDRLERHWKRGGRVVDVGCGPGNWLEFLRENGYEACGVETSAAAAQQARDKGFDVACCDLADYAPPAPLDGMISWYVLEHVDEIAGFIGHSSRVLPEGAVAVFATVDSGSTIYALAKLVHRLSLGRVRWPLQRICEVHHVQHFTRESLDRVLRDHGFSVLERFSAPFPAGSIETGPLQRAMVRAVYLLGGVLDRHIIQVVIARRGPARAGIPASRPYTAP
jgi:SAM-dependent methyltransferase